MNFRAKLGLCSDHVLPHAIQHPLREGLGKGTVGPHWERSRTQLDRLTSVSIAPCWYGSYPQPP